jgi:hypothetical protein
MITSAALLPLSVALALAGGVAQAAVDPAGEWVYEVQPGDTLVGIAGAWMEARPGWRGLQRLNRVQRPRLLQPGTRLRIPLAWLRPQATTAELLQVVGDVAVQPEGRAPAAAAAGAVLHGGDTVQVPAGGSALLRLADGSQVLLTPGTRLTLQQLLVQRASGAAISTLQLQEGSAESRVRREAPKPRFEIRTPVLNLGARGTEFRARFDPAQRRAYGEVGEGRVAAATGTGRGTAVDAGFGVVGTAGAVGTPVPLLAPPDLASLPPLLQRLPLRLPWAAQPAARGWRAQVFEAGAAGRLLLDGRFQEPLAEFADLPDGDYLLRVRAADAAGLEGRDAEAAFTLKARPEPPFLREPAADADLTGTGVRFVWTLSKAAAHYRLQVAADAGFTQPLHERTDLEGTELELPLPPGRWFWRLASLRGTGTAPGDQGPWSDTQVFELHPPPPVPPPPPVMDAPKLESGRVTLRWNAGPPGDGYEVQVARDDTFTDVVTSQRTLQPEVVLDAPPAGRYHVRSRRIARGGVPGVWGTPGEFEVPGWHWWWFTPVLLLFWL